VGASGRSVLVEAMDVPSPTSTSSKPSAGASRDAPRSCAQREGPEHDRLMAAYHDVRERFDTPRAVRPRRPKPSAS